MWSGHCGRYRSTIHSITPLLRDRQYSGVLVSIQSDPEVITCDCLITCQSLTGNSTPDTQLVLPFPAWQDRWMDRLAWPASWSGWEGCLTRNDMNDSTRVCPEDKVMLSQGWADKSFGPSAPLDGLNGIKSHLRNSWLYRCSRHLYVFGSNCRLSLPFWPRLAAFNQLHQHTLYSLHLLSRNDLVDTFWQYYFLGRVYWF